MYPTLIGEGDWALPSYFAMLMLGFFLAVWLLRYQADKKGMDRRQIVDLSIFLLIAGVVGARLFHVLFDGYFNDYINLCLDPSALGKALPSGLECTADDVCRAAQDTGQDIGELCNRSTGLCEPAQDCFRALKFWSGGLTYYGGFLFSLVVAIVFTRRWKWSFLDFADMAAPTVAVALAFGRVGCFLSGCCFGEVCDLPWAVRFPAGSAAWRAQRELDPGALTEQFNALGRTEWLSLPVHPTQLYEAGAMFAVFALLWFGLRTRKKFEGQVIAWLLIFYGLVRFTVEFWRADQRGGIGIFSTSQWISFPLVGLGVFLLYWGAKRARNLPAGTLSEAGDPADSDAVTPDQDR
ncbi:MAG: hypothetical protein AUK47_25770 [Deltaproteobacteria bacterium CG2_30_63_29]|nr:MAG: hypothetical protein AUK47_25770 [Deltaproteobacteria bacterium CG2_30_63_29]PJB47856.1 MAG: hypothetical protein CO108_03415 [Deltaproteobacteria bacterium CG_4_9_14_3_um_filter_63_12]